MPELVRGYRRGHEVVHVLVDGRLVRFAHVAQPRDPRYSGLRRPICVQVQSKNTWLISIHVTNEDNFSPAKYNVL